MHLAYKGPLQHLMENRVLYKRNGVNGVILTWIYKHLSWNPPQKGETFHQEPGNTLPFFDYNFQVEWDTLLDFIPK